MKQTPARGLPPRIYLPLVAAIIAIAGIPIAIFLHTGFATTGSSIGTSPGGMAPPPMIAQAVAELRKRIAQNPHDVEAVEALAGLELEAGRLAPAADLEAKAIALNPRNMQLRSTYADVLSDLGRGSEARAQLDLILRQQPKNADAWYGRGTLDERLGNKAAAAADFAQYLRYAPANDPRRAALVGHVGTTQ